MKSDDVVDEELSWGRQYLQTPIAACIYESSNNTIKQSSRTTGAYRMVSHVSLGNVTLWMLTPTNLLQELILMSVVDSDKSPAGTDIYVRC